MNRISYARKNGVKIEASSPDLQKVRNNPELAKAGLKIVENLKTDPRIIIYGISAGMSSDEIREELIAQNLKETRDMHLKVIYIYPVKDGRRTTSCAVEISPQVRNLLIARGRIFLRFSACTFSDHVRVLQCFKCLGFGHRAAECKSDPLCGYCAGAHEMRNCRVREQPPRCGNCNRNRTTRTVEDRHSALDAKKCPILCSKIKDRITNINYE